MSQHHFLTEQIAPKQIALFGTSADPPTLAHQAILEWLAGQFQQVAVWAADNPFKSGQTPLLHRQEMLRLLVENLQTTHPQVGLYPELSDRRTLHSVERARAIWPETVLTLVVGSDVISKLLHWYRVDDLLSQVQLLIVHRPDAELSQADLEQLCQRGADLQVADFVGPAVSSTALRQHQTTMGLLPAIADYIQREGLYPWPDSVPSPILDHSTPNHLTPNPVVTR